MKRSHPYSIAAMVSSILLAGGFVAYRAGAFDRMTEPSIVDGKPTNPAEREPASSSRISVPSTPEGEDQIMGGTKTGVISFPSLVEEIAPLQLPNQRSDEESCPLSEPAGIRWK